MFPLYLNVIPQWKTAQIDVFKQRNGQYKICSGATVFHRRVLNVTTPGKIQPNISFSLYSVDNKSGIHVHQNCVRCSALCLLLPVLSDLSHRYINKYTEHPGGFEPCCSEDASHAHCLSPKKINKKIKVDALLQDTPPRSGSYHSAMCCSTETLPIGWWFSQ